MPKLPKNKQRIISFGRGGWRPGAGRKPTKAKNKIVLHRSRPTVSRRSPAHITLEVRPELRSLRTKRRVQVIRRAFVAGCQGKGFRIVDWSIQGSHLHLLVEADSKAELARGMQGFCIRVARGLNSLAGRRGAVFTERYHLRLLTTPAQVRHARAYALLNFRRHAWAAQRSVQRGWVDPYSSWAWFDGWRSLPQRLARAAAKERAGPPVVAEPKGWLLRVGWRRRGLIDVNEVPGAWQR